MANPALDGSTPPQAQATAPASTIQVPDACAQSMVTLGGQIDGHISEVAQMVQGPVEGNTAGSDSSESAVGVDVSGTAANEGTGLVSSALGMSLGYPPASKRPNGVPGLSGSSLNADSVSPSLAHPTEGVDRASGSLAASTTGSTDSPGGAQMEQLHTMYASTVASSSAQAEVEIASLTGTAAAKSADRADRKSGVSKSNGIGAIKIEQVNEEKGDTKLEMAVGIPSANPGRTMVSSDPHSAFAKGSALDAEPVVGVRVVVAQPENAPLTGSVGHDVSDSQPATVRGAVQAVMQVVDLQSAKADASSSSVNLHFKIGDSSLAVRVEMQSGTVHTQFITDSTDLRNAISREGQSVTNSPTSKSTQFADPVFSSSGDTSSTFGQASQQGREQQQASQNYSQDLANLGVPSKPSRPADATPTSIDSTVEVGSEVATQSARLKTFA